MSRHEIPDFNQYHITVVGDVMLDRYWHGQTARISPEAPVPVVHIKNCEARPGGAGNVALNLNSLGCHTHLFGMRGDDENGEELTNQLANANVDCHFQIQTTIPTCTKLRVISRNQQIVRLDFEEIMDVGIKPNDFATFDHIIAKSHVMILSDYGKGTLTEVAQWIQAARQKNIPVLVDPKGHDFIRYRGATVLTPNYKEFEMVVGRCRNEADILQKATQAIHDADLQALLITRGSEGMMLVTRDGKKHVFTAMALEVFDVTGAGDTVIATLAAFLGAGFPLPKATEWANYAAGCVVAKFGAVSITPEELISKVTKHQISVSTGVMTLSEAKSATTSAKQHGERIVFTNGCFDILHAGHVHYLQQAKTFGDRLVVAVNDDASVTRLKGEGRPINPLMHRMKVLAALGVVDWVIPFSEDTPLKVIQQLSPDVLVKGGDYQINDIVGADFVQMQGGQVKVLDFVDGLSTTHTINKIKTVHEELEGV